MKRNIFLLIMIMTVSFVPFSEGAEPQDEAKELNREASQLYTAGKYEEAMPLAKRSLEILENAFGKDHPYVATSLIRLARLYESMGRYAEAEPLFRRALEIREKVFGRDHPDVAESLHRLAELCLSMGRYAEAEPLFRRALEIREKVFGRDHPDVAESLHGMAKLYQLTERYSDAEPLYKRSLEIGEMVFGKDHPNVGINLDSLARLYESMGRYSEVEPLYKRSLEIKEKVFGRDHPYVAESLNSLANLYVSTARYSEAEPLFKKALEINERTFGKDHIFVTAELSNLAGLYQSTARYSDAELLFKRSVEIREKVLGRDDPEVATVLSNLAGLYQSTARYSEAESLFKRSIEIREKALGRDHTDVAVSLNNLAAFYRNSGQYSEAEPLYKRSLEIFKKILGKDHPYVATSLCNLAELYETTGRYAEAEPLYKRALEIREKALGKDHPDVAQSLHNLALLYLSTARYSKAESLLKRSIEILENAMGKNNPIVAAGIDNLAGLYSTTGRYAEAEPLYKRAQEIREKGLGKDHPDVATSLDNLGQLYETTGRYAEAEPLLKRALEIREKALGKDHPDVAGSLNSMSGLYNTTGEYSKAASLLKRSIGILEKAMGKDNPRVVRNLSNQAVLYAITGKDNESHELFTRAITMEDKKRENVFQLLAEKEKLTYMNQNEGDLHAFISHSVGRMQTEPDAIKDTLNAWLRWKGAVLEAQGRYKDALYNSGNPEIQERFNKLNVVRKDIARLQLGGPGKTPLEEYRKQIETLEKKKEALEAELSGLSKDFALEKTAGKADIKKISEVLPKDSVYLDFARINIYNFNEKTWEKPRYLAFVLVPSKDPEVRLLDIADSKEIEDHIRAYRQEMEKVKRSGMAPSTEVLKKESRALYDLAIKPMESFIKGKKQLFISPDGSLNLIPFEALMTPEGRYLMEDYNISYVAAGRDIVRFADTNVADNEAVIFADPDYDLGIKEKERITGELRVAKAIRGPVSRDASGLRFTPLPDTKKEADAIEKILSDKKKTQVKNYQEKKALEEVLFSGKPPRILHLATHGYFLADEEVKQDRRAELLSFQAAKPIPINIENPMLRSGIALAGVNTSLREGRDDGLISAEKVLGLKLKGTDLVVLSACETGVGDLQDGEGVFGLKRAFILSGAKTLVMSLWSVPSAETTELMTEFYRRMAEGNTKSEALREAKLAMMKKNPNPFFWGAFVMTGKPD